MKRHLKMIVVTGILLALFVVWLPAGSAANNCVFNTVGNKMILTNDCTTDSTILIPDGYILDGRWHTITAVDPVGDSFRGAVVQNAGTVAHVRYLNITTPGLAVACHSPSGPDERLRGILFNGASGSIVGNTVTNLRQVASGCQEGNSIEVRNAPFDGTHPNTKTVTILGNTVRNYMKTGILANGDVKVDVQLNNVGSSANQANLAANGIQLGFGALGNVRFNNVGGNSWCCVDAAATGVLIYLTSDGVNVRYNSVKGNADVGIYFEANNGAIRNNLVYESGPDGFYDVGIGNYGNNNVVRHNTVIGYQTPYEDPNSLSSLTARSAVTARPQPFE